jgi:hypothetical protein
MTDPENVYEATVQVRITVRAAMKKPQVRVLLQARVEQAIQRLLIGPIIAASVDRIRLIEFDVNEFLK